MTFAIKTVLRTEDNSFHNPFLKGCLLKHLYFAYNWIVPVRLQAHDTHYRTEISIGCFDWTQKFFHLGNKL